MEVEPILFVYNDSPMSRKQARKHVSKIVRGREHRQRYRDPFVRAKLVYSTRDKHAGNSDKLTQGNTSDDPPKIRRLADGGSQYVRCPPSLSYEGDRDQSANGSHVQTVGEVPRQGQSSHVGPYFSAARSDPFCTLPVMLDPESAKCLDHFNTSMPYLEFCVHEGAPLIPSRHVAFRSALETPAALHAIIATGATHLASLYGRETMFLIQHHVGQALGLLRSDMLSVNKANWARIAQTMTEVAAGDDFRGNIQNSRVHLNGLRELMATFGGIEKMQATPRIQLLTCYVLNGSTAAYFPTIRCTTSTLARLEGALCDRESCHSSIRVSDLIGIGISTSERRVVLEVRVHVRDFCAFLDRIRPQPSGNVEPSVLRLRKVLPHYFYPENKLRKRLSIAGLDRERFGGLGPKGNHRMSCLFAIIVKLLRLSDAGDQSGLILYLEKLQCLSHSNLRLLQFILMQDGSEVRMNDAAMSWEIVRLTQVYKLMSEDWRRSVDNTLVSFLINESDEEVEDGHDSSESPKQERFSMRAIMGDVVRNMVDVIGD